MRSVALKDIAEIIRGVTFSRGEGAKREAPGLLPVIRAGNIQARLLLDQDLVWVPESKVKDHQKIRENDIVMCTSSGSSAVVGKSAMANEAWNGSFGAFCAGIRVRDDSCDPSYLRYVLASAEFRNWASGSSGANIKNIRSSELGQYRIPLPILSEQKRIATILEKADALRRKRQLAIELADQFLRSVFLEMFGDPVSNPKGWPKGKIRDLVSEAKYGTSQKAHTERRGLPVLRMGNITYEGGWDFSDLKYVELVDKEYQKHRLKKGDLLFNRTNSKELVGKTAVFEEEKDMVAAGYLVRIRTNDLGNPYYISGYLNSKHGKQTLFSMCKSIVGMANINAQEVQDIDILIPPKSVQDRFELLTKQTRLRVKKFHEALGETEHLFASLSSRAFSGNI